MKSEFNVGDKVKVIKSICGYCNFKAIIKKVDNPNGFRPYYCHILDNENNIIDSLWLSKEDLIPLKNSEKYFTISLKKHKRINLKFAL